MCLEMDENPPLLSSSTSTPLAVASFPVAPFDLAFSSLDDTAAFCAEHAVNTNEATMRSI
jgi:hypothetical protein